MKKKRFKRSALSIVLSISVLMTTVSAIAAVGITETAKKGILENAADGKQIHERMDISEIRNEGGDPLELLSSASALAAAEKPWYEYIRYSSEPVGICMVNDTSRIVFHDPYDYANSLVMEIDDSITDWSSANSLTATYETGNTLAEEKQVSNETVTSVERAKGADYSSDVSTTTVDGQVDTYNSSKTVGKVLHGGYSEDSGTDTESGSTKTEYNSWHAGTVGQSETEFTVGVTGLSAVNEKIIIGTNRSDNFGSDTVEHGKTNTIDQKTTYHDETSYSDDYEVSDTGHTIDNTTTTTKTDVTTVIADRMSSSLGQNVSEGQSWSTSDSHSISKTYNASYFNSSGSPLQWKIVKYKVIMPMLYKTQYLIDGEWITSEDGYCTLTTIQGTCRAWLENNTAYYEHWGTGEPVTWNEFWGTFFTKEKLVEAYTTKLYPDQIRRTDAE